MEYVIGLYDLEGNFIDKFSSTNDLSDFLGIDHLLIYPCLNSGSGILIKKFQIIKKTTKNQLPVSIGNVVNRITGINKPIGKYYNGVLICVYNSVNEAAQKTGINKGNISRSANSSLKASIFNFKYIK